MSVLPVSLLVQIALSCPAGSSFPPGHIVDRVRATAETESRLQTTALRDNSTGRSYVPRSAAEAVALVTALHAQGHSLDAGIMQVNDANWPRLGLTAETVFDPHANVCAGMAVLAEGYTIERRVSCRYNTGTPDCHNGYPERIERAAAQLRQSNGPAAPSPALSAPAIPPGPPPPPSWDVWGQADYLDAQTATAQPEHPVTPDTASFEVQPLPAAEPKARPIATAPAPTTTEDDGASSVAMVTGTPVRQ